MSLQNHRNHLAGVTSDKTGGEGAFGEILIPDHSVLETHSLFYHCGYEISL